MAIIVDKKEKRRNIALACKDLLIQSGVQEPTISNIAQAAGIGKGTFYEYFKSKEELLFELVGILMTQHNAKIEKRLGAAESIKEKIKIFASFFYDQESADLRKLYKIFTGTSLLHPQEHVRQFQTECFDEYFLWFERILTEGIQNNEIIPESSQMAKGIFATAKGLFVVSETTHAIPDLEEEMHLYIDTVLSLLSTKESR